MGMQRAEGPGPDPGVDHSQPAEESGMRLAVAIDPRMVEVWSCLFSADLDAEELASQIGWFLRMAYLRGYHDGLSEPEAGALYRELGMRVPARRRSDPQRITTNASRNDRKGTT